MRSFNALLAVVLTAPVAVFACEGDCMVGITNAFLGNYTLPVYSVLHGIVCLHTLVEYDTDSVLQAADISTLFSDKPSADAVMPLLRPITDAYSSNAFDGLKTAIFPSFFHGKCLQDGHTPEGCPNPDCPVVCGTPGSLVHFYPKLRWIAFNATVHLLRTLSDPSSDTYHQVEQRVMDVAHPHTRRMLKVYARSNPYGTTPMPLLMRKREEEIKTRLKQIMTKIQPLLLDFCGGTNGVSNGLPFCSWEDAMKAYILTFP